jgi:putative polymerase
MMTKRSAIFLLAFLAITYNGILAILNANVMSIGRSHSVIVELLIIGAGLGIAFIERPNKEELLPYLLLVAIGCSSALIVIANGTVPIETIRNFLIVVAFTLLGMRMNQDTLNRLVFVTTMIVFVVLCVEVISVAIYVSIFEPAQYYLNTRGMEIKSFNETGLFGNSLAVAGRFNFGLFSSHRTSSIFLEQVSLANFSSVVAIYLAAFWNSFKKSHRTLIVITLLFIVLTNNSRTASAILALCLAIRMMAFWNPKTVVSVKNTLMISIVLLATFIAYQNDFAYTGDNFVGRISLGMSHLYELELIELFGFGYANLGKYWDSGYAYLLTSNTVLLAGMFIFFIHTFLRNDSHSAIIFSTLLVFYISLNLLIGGNAIYSMKTSPILWMGLGFIKSQQSNSKAYADSTNSLRYS